MNRGVWHSASGDVEVAVKSLQAASSEEERVKFLQEAAIMGQFRHPNIVRVFGVITATEPVCVLYTSHCTAQHSSLHSLVTDEAGPGVDVQGRSQTHLVFISVSLKCIQ